MAVNKSVNPLDFFQVVDCISNWWSKATYDTPLSHVPVIGLKSPINPLGKAYRKAYSLGEFKGQPEEGFFVKYLSPMSPSKGPPLPKLLNQRWPSFIR